MLAPDTIRPQAKTGELQREVFEKMARWRFQNPTPRRRGRWWVDIRRDVFVAGEQNEYRPRSELRRAEKSFRGAQKIADKYMRLINQGLESIGSATNFNRYVETTSMPLVMPLLAKSTQGRYEGIVENYLKPAFGKFCLRDLTPLCVQRYFSQLTTFALPHRVPRQTPRRTLEHSRFGSTVWSADFKPGRKRSYASGAPRQENLETISL